MASQRREDLDARLRAANVARRHDDAFFEALGGLAASSEKASTRRRPTAARVTSIALGTGLLLSGGAVASAFILIQSDAHHRSEPRPATTVHLNQSAGPTGASAGGSSTADDNGSSGLPQATVGPGRAHQDHTSAHAPNPPGNAYGLHGETPQGNARGQGHGRPHGPANAQGHQGDHGHQGHHGPHPQGIPDGRRDHQPRVGGSGRPAQTSSGTSAGSSSAPHGGPSPRPSPR